MMFNQQIDKRTNRLGPGKIEFCQIENKEVRLFVDAKYLI